MAQRAEASPRDAATVVVARQPAPLTTELFFVQRAAAAPFMPNAWVFPGGRVDSADGDPGSDGAFRGAAARECLEEAHLAVDPTRLAWIDTWLTPSAHSQRYTTRFYSFMVNMNTSRQARVDGYEVVDSRWATAHEMLARWQAGDADLPPPTLCLVTAMARKQLAVSPPGSIPAPTDLHMPILPKVMEHAKHPTVVLPHDPEYAQLAGESGQAPSRAHVYPPRLERRENRWIPLGSALLVMAIAGCRDEAPAPSAAAPPPSTESAPAQVEPDPDVAPASRDIFAWCDPDAVGGVYGSGTREFDLTTLATIFALPPRGRETALADTAVRSALGSLSVDDAQATDKLWGERWISFNSPLARAPFVLRELRAEPAVVETLLTAVGFNRRERDGFVVFQHQRAFPWKIVLLDRGTAAFVPRSEIGSGLTPLTAARDLPPGALAEQLRDDARQNDLILTSYVAGPMLHLNLAHDVEQAQWRLRRWQSDGLDGAIALMLGADVAVGSEVAALTQREGIGETERTRALMRRVAFEAEGQTATGRLQIPARDVPRAAR
ncbi:MAG: NUDIX hydrolase [Myxococcales bacterium FL481]|nr:MAG: NUDIX hydrolase [Myxococcales bacterium FL481]